MNQHHGIDIPHGEEVSTEPQRRALEAMSQDLVAKLNAMVAEQERRAQDFARQQHSLSSLPSQTLPEISAPALPEINVPNLPEQPLMPPPQQRTQGVKARMGEQTSTHAPALPPTPQAQSPRQQARNAWDYQWDTGNDKNNRHKTPTIIRESGSEKKEGSIGAGTISVIIFIILVLIMHGCE